MVLRFLLKQITDTVTRFFTTLCTVTDTSVCIEPIGKEE